MVKKLCIFAAAFCLCLQAAVSQTVLQLCDDIEPELKAYNRDIEKAEESREKYDDVLEGILDICILYRDHLTDVIKLARKDEKDVGVVEMGQWREVLKVYHDLLLKFLKKYIE